MRPDLRGVAGALTLGLALGAAAYTAFAIVRLRAFGRRLREPAAAPVRRPMISVLKPVRGAEPGLEQQLDSFCVQDYPRFEVLFAVRDAADAALPVVERVVAAHPLRAALVTGGDPTGARNPKIDNVAAAYAKAQGDIVAIADSDMRVTPAYLDAVAAAFDDPLTGAATAIYRGEPADATLASRLGAMWITEQFAPSTLVATAIEPLTYTFGSTMAVRRDVLDAAGGLAALGGHLADDHALGRLVTAAGYRVALATYVVENVVTERGLRALLEHELRWARTIRSVRPGSYPGIILTYPVPLALLALAVARRKRTALAVFALAVALRTTLQSAACAALGARTPPSAALLPLRDALGVAVWACGLFGRTVRWRGDTLRTG